MNGSGMKARRYRESPFNNWRDAVSDKYGPYIWAQINYNWTTGAPFVIVYEKNGKPRNVEWPVTRLDTSAPWPAHHIDFTREPSFHVESKATWDYKAWAGVVLKSTGNPVSSAPSDYWDYRSQARPYGNKACDLDAYELARNGRWFGVEATRFNIRTKNRDDAIKYFFYEILANRPAGFNQQQLEAQLSYVKHAREKSSSECNGNLFIIIYHETDSSLEPTLPCLAFEVDRDVLTSITKRDITIFRPPRIAWDQFGVVYDHLIAEGTP